MATEDVKDSQRHEGKRKRRDLHPPAPAQLGHPFVVPFSTLPSNRALRMESAQDNRSMLDRRRDFSSMLVS